MSLRKCEKLMAPKTLNRVLVAWAAAGESAVRLFSISGYPTSYFVACPERMRRGSFRTLCFSARPRISLGRAGVHRRARTDRLFGRDVTGSVRAAVAARNNAAVARSDSFAGIRGTHDVPHVGRARPLAGVHPDLRDLGGQERAGRQAVGADPGYSAIGPDPGLHFHYRRVLHVVGSGKGAGCGIRGHLRYIHQPSVE